MKPPVLRHAVIPLQLNTLSHMAQLLPTSFGIAALHSLLVVAARLGKNYALPETLTSMNGMEIIDRYGRDLRLVEKMHFSVSPTSWRTDTEVEVFGHYLRQFAGGRAVDLRECLEPSGMLRTLEAVNHARQMCDERRSSRELGAAMGHEVQTTSKLATLETLHKVLVNYIWLGFRMPMSFNQHPYALELKEETEKGIEFILEGIEDVHGRLEKREVKTLKALREEKKVKKIDYIKRVARVPDKVKRAELV